MWGQVIPDLQCSVHCTLQSTVQCTLQSTVQATVQCRATQWRSGLGSVVPPRDPGKALRGNIPRIYRSWEINTLGSKYKNLEHEFVNAGSKVRLWCYHVT